MATVPPLVHTDHIKVRPGKNAELGVDHLSLSGSNDFVWGITANSALRHLDRRTHTEPPGSGRHKVEMPHPGGPVAIGM